MRTLRRWLRCLGSWATTERDEERLHAEIEEHLALLTREGFRAGLSPAEARRQTVLKFGGVEAIKESYRDQRGLPLMELGNQRGAPFNGGSAVKVKLCSPPWTTSRSHKSDPKSDERRNTIDF
jgi:hypothetical protein